MPTHNMEARVESILRFLRKQEASTSKALSEHNASLRPEASDRQRDWDREYTRLATQRMVFGTIIAQIANGSDIQEVAL